MITRQLSLHSSPPWKKEFLTIHTALSRGNVPTFLQSGPPPRHATHRLHGARRGGQVRAPLILPSMFISQGRRVCSNHCLQSKYILQQSTGKRERKKRFAEPRTSRLCCLSPVQPCTLSQAPPTPSSGMPFTHHFTFFLISTQDL